MLRLHMFLAGLLLALAMAAAAAQSPEIQRGPIPAQVPGVLHTLPRTIPEAMYPRLEGRFTKAKEASPYALTQVRTGTRCQARARLLDARKAQASAANGWILNDVLRVPNASCSGQSAVIRIWRKDAASATPKLDAQGDGCGSISRTVWMPQPGASWGRCRSLRWRWAWKDAAATEVEFSQARSPT